MSVDTRPPAGGPPDRSTSSKEQQPYVELGKKRHTGIKVLAIVVFWLLCWALFQGQATKELGLQDTTNFHDWLNGIRDWVQLHGPDNWFFGSVLGFIGDVFNNIFEFLQKLVSVPAFPRPVPQIGWLGVVGIATWIAWACAGLRQTILVVITFLLFGVFGLWQDSIDLLLVTGIAVATCFVIGLPVGIAMARRRSVSAAITPVLDIMQTMPPFAYLAPIALGFGIGPTTAIVLTVIYALPPLVRITEFGIRSVSPTTIEAARSMGLTKGQLLRQVQLPMSRRTIVVGVNQSMMAALSMATIAALVNGPGLGKDVNAALQIQNIGAASVAGLLIVLMAITLDRTITASSERSEATGRANVVSVSGPGVMMMGVVIERLPSLGHRGRRQGCPATTAHRVGPLDGAGALAGPGRDPGLPLAAAAQPRPVPHPRGLAVPEVHRRHHRDQADQRLLELVHRHRRQLHAGPEERRDHLDHQPVPEPVRRHPLVDPGPGAGGRRLCARRLAPGDHHGRLPGGHLRHGLWNDAMVTLTMTLIATVVVMVIAVVLGVGMGRNRRTDKVIRPFLDAFQVIPPFVYLVPALALFGVGRFTAIMAAVAYAVPIATKLVADGIRGVAPTTVEAARANGSTTWQMITKVQLPMSREALVLATNQGLLYVLSMVVIGGLVGGGSLGYIVVSGFSQDQLFGKGLAAGIAITALGVMLDRIARYAAARYGR
jgi:glycine betaine/proline transport system permease protein